MRALKRIAVLALGMTTMAVFWNWLPLAYTFRVMCEKDSGFFIYMTPREWVDTNKSALINIDKSNLENITSPWDIQPGIVQYKFFGGLLLRETKENSSQNYGMDIWRTEDRIIDVRSGIQISKRIDYSIGPPEDIRIWLTRQSCFSDTNKRPVAAEQIFKSQLKEEIR